MILNDLDFATVSETKAGLSALLKRLHETKRALAVTSHGKPAGILLDVDEYKRLTLHLEEMEATLEVLSDPEMLAGLRRGIEEAKAGKVVSFEEVFGEPLVPKRKRK
jgi:prevent-host-death family protein